MPIPSIWGHIRLRSYEDHATPWPNPIDTHCSIQTRTGIPKGLRANVVASENPIPLRSLWDKPSKQAENGSSEVDSPPSAPTACVAASRDWNRSIGHRTNGGSSSPPRSPLSTSWKGFSASSNRSAHARLLWSCHPSSHWENSPQDSH